MTPRRRPILMAGLCLAGGLALNVLVAWACAVWSPMADSRNPEALTRHDVGAYIDRSPWPYKLRPGDSVASASFGLEYERLESGGDDAHFWHVVRAVRAGFPLPSLYGERWINHAADADPAMRTALIAALDPGALGLDADVDRLLPLRPILPGFITNTILDAAALWMILSLPFMIRGRRRWRSRLCPRCAVALPDPHPDAGQDPISCPACRWMRGITNAHRLHH